jgi:hypothetical protein
MEVIIDKKRYLVNDNEYKKINHSEYNNLKLYNDIEIHERLIGLIKKCKQVFLNGESSFISFDTTHGGFIPINLSYDFDNIINDI